MAFARREPSAVTMIDVNQAILAMEGVLEQSLGTIGKLIFNLATEAWPARGDASQLEMAILNLVVNARDAMTAEGTVQISTMNRTLHGEHDNLSGDYVAVAVSDTGSGMPPEILALAFEPLFTTKGPGKGTGLGLASVYRFARQCDGVAVIESELDKGTTVTIYLPRAQRATTERATTGIVIRSRQRVDESPPLPIQPFDHRFARFISSPSAHDEDKRL